MVTVRLYTCSFIVSFRLRFGRTVVERAAIGQRALRVPCYPFPCRTVCGIDGWCCATMRRNALRRRRRRRGAHAAAPPRRLCRGVFASRGRCQLNARSTLIKLSVGRTSRSSCGVRARSMPRRHLSYTIIARQRPDRRSARPANDRRPCSAISIYRDIDSPM